MGGITENRKRILRTLTHEQATSVCLSDDLEDEPTSDTVRGWGCSNVFPGLTTLEANNADPTGLSDHDLLDLLPDGADSGTHSDFEDPYVGAYISAPTELSYKAAMDPTNPERDQWLLDMKDEMESLRAHGT